MDCPASLVPMHVKAKPEPECNQVTAMLPRSGEQEVWDKSLCPAWCMEAEPVYDTPTESGPVSVRECPVQPDQ